MKRFLLINSILGYEEYFESSSEFSSALFAQICGKAKIVRVLVDDSRALTVYEICDTSNEYTL